MRIKDTMKIPELLPKLFECDKNKIYDIDIKEHKEKRSLDSNSYYWVLVGKIGNLMRMSKEEVHMTMLERYGQYQVIKFSPEVVLNGYIKYYKAIGKIKENGKEMIAYRIFKGSSEYDTEEMSILIDGIVQECQELGIETMSPFELERMKSAWGN